MSYLLYFVWNVQISQIFRRCPVCFVSCAEYSRSMTIDCHTSHQHRRMSWHICNYTSWRARKLIWSAYDWFPYASCSHKTISPSHPLSHSHHFVSFFSSHRVDIRVMTVPWLKMLYIEGMPTRQCNFLNYIYTSYPLMYLRWKLTKAYGDYIWYVDFSCHPLRGTMLLIMQTKIFLTGFI